jgi:serine protease
MGTRAPNRMKDSEKSPAGALALAFLLGLFTTHCTLDSRQLHAPAKDADQGAGDESQREETAASASERGDEVQSALDAAAGPMTESLEVDAQALLSVDPLMGRTGSGCARDVDCSGPDMGPGTCITQWPGGYCSSPCVEFTNCAGTDSTVCRELEGTQRCLLACFGDLDCRDGYVCDPELFGCVLK